MDEAGETGTGQVPETIDIGKYWEVMTGNNNITPTSSSVTFRSETVFSHQPSRGSVREQRQRQRHSSLEKIQISTGLRAEGPSQSSSVVECELNSSPVLERPNTLPELNSRPASRVMKSFSCDGVRSGGLSLDFI